MKQGYLATIPGPTNKKQIADIIMTKLTVLQYPDPRLRKKANKVEVFDDKLAALIDDLFETMYKDNGVGFAATQANIQQSVFVADPQENGNKQPFYMINPRIINKTGEIKWQEGCLSVPSAYEYVKRANHIKVEYQDKTGAEFVMEAKDYLAVIIQHESDHLDGKLFIDYLSSIKRDRVRRKITK